RALEGLAVRQGDAAHERLSRADLFARTREQAQPGRYGHHARGATTGGRPGADVEAVEWRHLLQAPVHRRRSDEAAGHRPEPDRDGPGRLAEVPRREGAGLRPG